MTSASILIVEDNNIVMMELRDRLEEAGYNVIDYAPSGFEAVQKAEEFHPDLIMMDIRLKGEMDGIDAAARIKNELDIPVIYLTAHTDGDTLQRAKITEPYGYVIKPFEERELFSTIEMALYKHAMEKKLKESRHWLSTTLKSIGDALVATDSKGIIKIINRVAEDLTEWKYNEAYGKDINDIFKIKDKDNPILLTLRYLSITGLSNIILMGKNGKETPIDFSSAPIKDENGKISGIVLVFRDITEKVQAKELIEKQRVFLRQIIDTDPNYISVKDIEGKYELTNKAAAEALGTDVDEIIGKRDVDFFDSEEIKHQREIEMEVINSLEDIYLPEDKLMDADGKVHLLQTFKKAIDSQDGDRKLVLSVASDITELKKTENALRESEQRIKTLLKAIPDIVLRYKKDGTVLDFHIHDSELLFQNSKIIGENISSIFEEEFAKRILSSSEKALSSGLMQVFEHNLIVDGQVNHKEIRVVGLLPNYTENSGDECIIIIRDITIQKTAQKEMMKYLSEIKESKNILEHKTFELSNLNQKLNESEKELKELNASKDKFFSIIAHDLRSPFTSLLGLTDYLATECNNISPDELKGISGNLLKSAKSTFNLLENLLQWARIRTGRIKFNPEVFNLKSVVNQMIDLYKGNALTKNISIDTRINSDIYVFADLNMVETIFRNLISNSIKFTKEGGKITLSVTVKSEFAEINVEDNGVGINSETLGKLFQVDQNISTLGTQNEEGSGFGLILCKEFIEMNKGKISVKSEVENGSIFSFTLPIKN